MKPKLVVLTLLSMLMMNACTPRKSGNNDSRKTITNYKPPVFASNTRKDDIRAAAADVDSAYQRYAREHHFPAIVYGVVVDDELILSGAAGFTNVEKSIEASTKSLFRIASMTKSFTAMAIVKLRDDGKLQLDEPASKYIPALNDVAYLTDDAPPITIRNLLTMSAGFPEDNPWGDRQLADKPEELEAFIREGISFSNVPSKEFEYSNMGYAMLGQIIQAVSQMPYQRYISENLLQPLGMNDTRWEHSEVDPALLASGYRWEEEQWKPEPLLHDGIYGAMGGLITSIEDFSKYVKLHLAAWPPRNGDDTGPVKRSSLREMHKPGEFRGMFAPEKQPDGSYCTAAGGYGYGLGWRRNCDGLVRISHSGGLPGFGSEYRFFPELGVGIICFANVTYAGAGSANTIVMDAILSRIQHERRVLPVSDSLQRRKDQVLTLLQAWSPALEGAILAENFYLDRRRDLRMQDAKQLFDAIGPIKQIDAIVPQNQLRGTFRLLGDRGAADIFFTLTPERSPRVQQIDWTILPVQSSASDR